jgi:hypothetical protein
MVNLPSSVIAWEEKVNKLGKNLPMKMESTQCSEASAYTFHTSGNHRKERINSEQAPKRKLIFTSTYHF